MNALLTIAQRDLTKLLRDRLRLGVNLIFPLTLVVGLGNVLRPTLGKATGLDAVTVAFTGVLAATMFQSTAAGMISLVEDRETDFSRELFVAPVSRFVLVGGKLLGETLVAVTQGTLVVLIALPFGIHVTAAGLALAAGPLVLCCLVGGAFGLATIAALPNQRSAMQIFQFLIIPQYVLGGVLVPVQTLPIYLAAVAAISPLRYGVDLARAAFYAGSSHYRQAVTLGPWIDLAVLAGLVTVLLVAGVALFEYRERAR